MRERLERHRQHAGAMNTKADAALRLTWAMGACLAVVVLAILLVILHYAGMITDWSLLAPALLAFPALGWAAVAERSYRSFPALESGQLRPTGPDNPTPGSGRRVPENSPPGPAGH